MADHGLGPNAVEIADTSMVSAFLLVGSLVYIAQPAHGVRDTIFLTRPAAETLARTILRDLGVSDLAESGS